MSIFVEACRHASQARRRWWEAFAQSRAQAYYSRSKRSIRKNLMRFPATTAVLCLWFPSVGLSMPVSGVCERASDLLGNMKVNWKGRDALVIQGDTTTPGSVMGMRPHDTGFKFSIFYEDPIMGPSEIIIFQRHGGQPRLGVVAFEDVAEDGLVVSSIFPFVDANCIILE